MEKEQNAIVLKQDENVGTVRIADDVVAMISSIAASEVEGAFAIGGSANEKFGATGSKRIAKGVKVDIRGNLVVVELAAAIKFGYHIPEVSQQIQSKVKSAIENMTGLTCGNVNVRFVKVNE